ncbi:MAG: DHH family phosphoesterase [Candidatus Thermoplasmatota archaeon]
MCEKKDLIHLLGEGLLLHHWDTDGICSARLILEFLHDKTITNVTPELGNYFLTEAELTCYSKYDFLIIVDMALPEENILRLSKTIPQIFIFDHHLQNIIPAVHHYNPISRGKNPDLYPSTSWIVNEFLKQEVTLWALLGVVGDHEQKILGNNAMYPRIEQYCSLYGISFDTMLRMVYLLDSCYKIGDKKQVEEAPRRLLDYTNGDMILQNSQWKKNLIKLDEEISLCLRQPQEIIKDVVVKKIDTTYNIISTITRKIAWQSGKNTLVINTGFFKDMDQIYVRSHKNVEPLIQLGKKYGFKTGGKAEVLGAIVPKEKTHLFVEKIIDFLTDTGCEVNR